MILRMNGPIFGIDTQVGELHKMNCSDNTIKIHNRSGKIVKHIWRRALLLILFKIIVQKNYAFSSRIVSSGTSNLKTRYFCPN